MIKELLEVIKPSIIDRTDVLNDVEVIGQMHDSVNTIFGLPSGGINDRVQNHAYIRYRSAEEFKGSIADVQFASEVQTFELKAELRFVAMIRCTNEDRIQRELFGALTNPGMTLPASQVEGIENLSLNVISVSSNVDYILSEEYPEKEFKVPNGLSLFLVDFDMEFLTIGDVCIKSKCDEC